MTLLQVCHRMPVFLSSGSKFVTKQRVGRATFRQQASHLNSSASSGRETFPLPEGWGLMADVKPLAWTQQEQSANPTNFLLLLSLGVYYPEFPSSSYWIPSWPLGGESKPSTVIELNPRPDQPDLNTVDI